MRKWNFAVVLALICLIFAGCGSSKPSEKQMKTDLEQTGSFSYQIEEVLVQSDQGDREDYRADVKINGSQDLLNISQDGVLQYRKNGGKWTLRDFSHYNAQVHLVRCPTEEEIFAGFSTLEPLENYLPCPCPQAYSSVYLDPNRLGDGSVIENVEVSDIRVENDSATSMVTSFGDPIYTPMISFEVSYRETYQKTSATVSYRVYYKYAPSEATWKVIADAANFVQS